MSKIASSLKSSLAKQSCKCNVPVIQDCYIYGQTNLRLPSKQSTFRRQIIRFGKQSCHVMNIQTICVNLIKSETGLVKRDAS